MPASFSKTAFCCCFLLVACLISAEQVPKSFHSTGNGFGPQQAGVVFELATENEISVCCLPALCTSHSPLLPPCLALHHTVVWICHWWMIPKTRSCPHCQMWMLGRLWPLHREWPQFQNVEQKQILILGNNYWKEKKNNVLLLHVWLLPAFVVPNTGSVTIILMVFDSLGVLVQPLFPHSSTGLSISPIQISPSGSMKGRNAISWNAEGLLCSQRISWPQPGVWLNAGRVPGAQCKMPMFLDCKGGLDFWYSKSGGGGGEDPKISRKKVGREQCLQTTERSNGAIMAGGRTVT